MPSFRCGQNASLVLAVAAALSSAGCPELNRYPDRGSNPLFSIDDATGRSAAATSSKINFVRRV